SRSVAVAVILGLYVAARNPDLTDAERTQLASPLHFTKMTIPAPFKDAGMSIRDLRPEIHHISGWATTGASIALADLDGDGLADPDGDGPATDMCGTDARYHYGAVRMVPATETRANPYQPIILDPAPLPYEPELLGLTGCLTGDFNEDGAMDVIIYFGQRRP